MKNRLVVKHNDLIQARYNLNLNEQKILLYAVSKIDRNKEDFNLIKINIKDFTEILGTTQDRYLEFRTIAQSLMTKTLIINTEGSELLTSWLSSMEYLKKTGTIELEFSRKLIPYLLQLQERFTRYQLENILYLKNKYSIRIYELMKQYENIGKRKFKLEEFKETLYLEKKYERIYDLERFVLIPAKKEINEYTDIKIDYNKIKEGRKITELIFTIETSKNKEYSKYLEKNYDIKGMKKKMGVEKENFNTEQIIELYEIAIKATESENEIDIFKYIKANYLYVNKKNKIKNKFAYFKKAIEEDYANFIMMFTLLK